MSEQDDGMFGLDGARDPVAGPPDEEPPVGRRRLLLIGLGAAAVVAGIAIAIGTATAVPARPAAPGSTVPATSPDTSSAPPSTTSAGPVTGSSAPQTTPTVYSDPTALADLRAVAATLTTPLTLTSPTTWDRWLPAGKPYPGKDTADDLSTCPRMADRLGAALGRKMSYWVGTLPGSGGCTWATVPLKAGPDAPNYPYLANVDFADGSTTEKMSRGFYHHQGHLCPRVAVPAAGRGAYLVRCEDLEGITYVVVTRDTRTAGVWSLSGSARSDAAHSARDVFRSVVAGAVHAYG
jgi:hypothetical protein